MITDLIADGPGRLPNYGQIYQITDAKKEARLLGVWPLATERDGGLSGSRCPVGAVLKEAAREAAS